MNTDQYFTLSGVTYATGTVSLGTQNTNFYRTAYFYDSKGRRYSTVNALGTITNTVYDSLDRVASTWVGTNASPSSGTWSPTNNSYPCNMTPGSKRLEKNGIGLHARPASTEKIWIANFDARPAVMLHFAAAAPFGAACSATNSLAGKESLSCAMM